MTDKIWNDACDAARREQMSINDTLIAALIVAQHYMGDDTTDDSPEARNVRKTISAAINLAQTGRHVADTHAG